MKAKAAKEGGGGGGGGGEAGKDGGKGAGLLSFFGRRRKVKVANLNDDPGPKLYYNNELKMWVEPGKEDEAKAQAAPPPPPKVPASSTPTAPAQRKALHQRYALQPNLSVSSGNLADQDSSSRQASPAPPSANSLLPAGPPTVTSAPSIFLPGTSSSGSGVPVWGAPTQNGGAPTQPKFFVPGVPAATAGSSSNGSLYSSQWAGSNKRRSSNDSKQQQQQQATGTDSIGQPQSTDSLPQSPQQQVQQMQQEPQQPLQCVDGHTEQPPQLANGHADPSKLPPSQENLVAHEAHQQQQVEQPSMACASSTSVNSNGDGHAAPPSPPPPPPATRPAPNLPPSARKQKPDPFNFDSVMHPGGTQKLDGPLPWELPDHLKHSDQFISICSNWQKQHPGVEYSPDLLLSSITGPPPPLPPNASSTTAAAAAAAAAATDPQPTSTASLGAAGHTEQQQPLMSPRKSDATPATNSISSTAQGGMAGGQGTPAVATCSPAPPPASTAAAVAAPAAAAPPAELESYGSAEALAGTVASGAQQALPSGAQQGDEVIGDRMKLPLGQQQQQQLEAVQAQQYLGHEPAHAQQQAQLEPAHAQQQAQQQQQQDMAGVVDVEDSSASQRQHQPDENPQVQGDGMGVDGPQFVEQQHAEQQQQQQQEQEQMTAEQYQSYWQAYYTQQAAVAGADASAQQYDADYYNSEEYRQYYAQWYAAQQAAAAASNGPQVQQMGGVPEEGSHLQQAWVAESQQQQDGLVGRESLQQQQQQQQHDQQQLLTHESLQQQQQQQPCLPAIQTQQHQPWVLGQQPEQPLPHRSSLVQAEQPLQHQYLQEIQPEQLLPHHSSQAQQEQPLQQLQSPQAQEHELPLHTNVSQAQPEQPLQHHFPQLSQAAHTQQPLHQHPSQPSTEQLMLQQRLSQSSEAAQAQQLPHQYSQLSEAAQAQQLPHQYSQLSEAAQAQQLPHQYSQIQPAHNLASAFGGGEAAADEAGDVSGFFSVGVPDAPSGGAPSAFSVHNRLALMQASSGVSFFQQEDEKEEEEEQRRQQQQQQQQQQEKVAQVSPPSPLSMEAPPHSQHPSLQPSLQDPHPQESKPGQAHDDPAAQEEEPHANGVTDVTAAAGACVGTEATMQANKQQQQQQQEQEQSWGAAGWTAHEVHTGWGVQQAHWQGVGGGAGLQQHDQQHHIWQQQQQQQQQGAWGWDGAQATLPPPLQTEHNSYDLGAPPSPTSHAPSSATKSLPPHPSAATAAADGPAELSLNLPPPLDSHSFHLPNIDSTAQPPLASQPPPPLPQQQQQHQYPHIPTATSTDPFFQCPPPNSNGSGPSSPSHSHAAANTFDIHAHTAAGNGSHATANGFAGLGNGSGPSSPSRSHAAAVNGGLGLHEHALQEANALSTLATTHSFMQQLLDNLAEGRPVHPATLSAAADLMRLFQDPRFTAATRNRSGPHSGASTPPKYLTMYTPVRTSTTRARAPSPTTDLSPSSQRTTTCIDSSYVSATKHTTQGEAGAGQAGQASLQVVGLDGPFDTSQDLSLQLASMQLELQAAFDQQLQSRTAELEAQFNARLVAMRAELEAQYGARIEQLEQQVAEHQALCQEKQDELDDLMACLGQEAKKVGALSDAMAEAGLDPEATLGPIEEEYWLMQQLCEQDDGDGAEEEGEKGEGSGVQDLGV